MSQNVPPAPAHATTAELPSRRRVRPVLLVLAGLLVVLLLFLSLMGRPTDGVPARVPLSLFAERLEAGGVHKVVVREHEIAGHFIGSVGYDGDTIHEFRVALPPGTGSSWAFTQWLLEHANGATVEADNDRNLALQILVPLIPWVLIFGFIWFFVFRKLRTQPPQQQPPTPIPVYLVGQESQPPPSPPRQI